MKSKNNLFELILTPIEACKLPKMPDSVMLERALDGCVCSDLFPNGFSYKPIDLGVGMVAESDEEYRLLKQLKSARYIHDQAKALPTEAIIKQLSTGILKIHSGYVGYDDAASLGFKAIRLADSDKLFGIELRPRSLFRCFVKTETTVPPKTITLNGYTLKILQLNPIEQTENALGVLQSNMQIKTSPTVADDSKSRFKLSFDENCGCIVVCAGSVIHHKDYFGDGVII